MQVFWPEEPHFLRPITLQHPAFTSHFHSRLTSIPSSQVFWPEEQHFLRPVTGHYTFANMHALGVPNVLSAWVRPEVSHFTIGLLALACFRSCSVPNVLSAWVLPEVRPAVQLV